MHQQQPAVARRFIDGETDVPHAQAGVSAGFYVARRPAEAEDEEFTQAFFRAGEIVLRVEGPEYLVAGNLAIKAAISRSNPFSPTAA